MFESEAVELLSPRHAVKLLGEQRKTRPPEVEDFVLSHQQSAISGQQWSEVDLHGAVGLTAISRRVKLRRGYDDAGSAWLTAES